MVIEMSREPQPDRIREKESVVSKIKDRAKGLNQFSLFELRDNKLEDETDRELITRSWGIYVDTLKTFGCERRIEVDEMFVLLAVEDIEQNNVPGGTFVHTADLLERMIQMKDYILAKAAENNLEPKELIYATVLHDTGKLMIPHEILNDSTPSFSDEAHGRQTHQDIFRERVFPRLKEMPSDHPIVARLRKKGLDVQTMTEQDIKNINPREYRYLVPLADLFEAQKKELPRNLDQLLDNGEDETSISFMDIIDRHQEGSEAIVRSLPWQNAKQADRVATLAGSHHQHLVRQDTRFAVARQLRLQANEALQNMARVLGIIDADVAITRNARPYQRGGNMRPMSEVHRILGFMARDGLFDNSILDEYIGQRQEVTAQAA